ncbi:unnamed protein product [Paramecium octaurelia]|uniref:UV excision repair protein RAD23 n=1 Tax=Paramecium octaurelia TaxID=43137 RepID=A0A8S1WCJ6_PAROT|nr:unnamed protein product [Paramecium octaurelia]
MKIIIKTLSGQTFDIEVQPTETVLNIKEKIEQNKQFEIAQQKLLRKGTLLQNEQTVAELGLQEKDFLVVMVNVKKGPPQQQPVQQQVQQPPQQPQPVQAQQPIQAPKPLVAPAPQNLVTGSEYDAAIQNLIQMGFAKSECEAAMKAAFNNPDRAIEYLLNGIPVVNQPPPPPQTQNENQEHQNAFQQLRDQFIQNPEAILQLLPQLQQTNPQLYQQIQQNPEALVQLILGGHQGGEDEIETEINQEDEQQLNQLIMMGFTKEDALEGFLACDKNVETAASYLFEKQARGDLLSQHYEREENNPDNYHDEGDEGEDDNDDDQYL